jgi:anti-anti-sigma factor
LGPTATSTHNTTSMQIKQDARDGCIVVTLTGDIDIAAAPRVQRTLLKCLAEQPDAVICDLADVHWIDPVCATVFATVAHRPMSRWPDATLLLCHLRPAVAVVLQQHGVPRVLPVYDTLDQAVAHARSRPPFLRERLRLVPTLEAIGTARWFVGEVCQRWQVDELTETAQALVGEITTDAVLYEPTGVDAIELRVELRATGFLVSVQSARPRPTLAEADRDDPGSGLEAVQRLAQHWGVRRQVDGSRVVWCVLRRAA